MSEKLNGMGAMLESLAKQKEAIEAELANCTDEERRAELSQELIDVSRRMVGGIPSSGLRR